MYVSRRPGEVDLCFFWILTIRVHTNIEIQAFTANKKVASSVVLIKPMSLLLHFKQTKTHLIATHHSNVLLIRRRPGE